MATKKKKAKKKSRKRKPVAAKPLSETTPPTPAVSSGALEPLTEADYEEPDEEASSDFEEDEEDYL